MDEAIDLRDRRGRLIRLVTACALGLAITLIVMALINSAGVRKGDDPVSAVSPFLLGTGIFLIVTNVSHAAIVRIRRRLLAR